jgi:hypothetical protein
MSSSPLLLLLLALAEFHTCPHDLDRSEGASRITSRALQAVTFLGGVATLGEDGEWGKEANNNNNRDHCNNHCGNDEGGGGSCLQQERVRNRIVGTDKRGGGGGLEG